MKIMLMVLCAFIFIACTSYPPTYKPGLEKYEAGDCEAAMSLLEQALAEQPKLERAAFTIGQCWQKKKDSDKALTYYQRAVEIDPYFANAWYNIGVIYFNKRNIPEALRAASRSFGSKEMMTLVKKLTITEETEKTIIDMVLNDSGTWGLTWGEEPVREKSESEDQREISEDFDFMCNKDNDMDSYYLDERKGHLVYRFIVNEDGSISDVKVKDSKNLTSEYLVCFVEQLSQKRYAPPPNGKKVYISSYFTHKIYRR